MEIENIRDISGIIRERKRFLKEVRMRTEITPNDNYNLYYDIMRYVCGTWHLDYNKDIAPKMRIAYNPNRFGGGMESQPSANKRYGQTIAKTQLG